MRCSTFRFFSMAIALSCAVSCQAHDSGAAEPPRVQAPQQATPQLASSGSERERRVLRNSYYECVEGNDGSTWSMQGCIEEEFAYQDARLNSTYRAVLAKMPDDEGIKLKEEERRWLVEKEEACKWDAEAEGQAQRIEANICSLKMTAERAAHLEGMMRKPAGL